MLLQLQLAKQYSGGEAADTLVILCAGILPCDREDVVACVRLCPEY